MGKLTMDDVFKAMAKPLPELEIKPGKTALILIDMQQLIFSDELLKGALEARLPEQEVRELLAEHDQTIRSAVRNAGRILAMCRQKGYDVIHVRLAAQTDNPRHTAKINRKADFVLPASSQKAQFLDEMKPINGELVFEKTNGGAFTGTNLDFVLRNMDITGIIAAGFLTDQCVLAKYFMRVTSGMTLSSSRMLALPPRLRITKQF